MSPGEIRNRGVGLVKQEASTCGSAAETRIPFVQHRDTQALGQQRMRDEGPGDARSDDRHVARHIMTQAATAKCDGRAIDPKRFAGTKIHWRLAFTGAEASMADTERTRRFGSVIAV